MKMKMLNKQKGNMYPWVTHTWNPIKGKCPHECCYCYMHRYWDRLGEPYLDEKCFKDNLGEGNTIFVGSSIDMWAEKIPLDWIVKVLDYIGKYPENTYLFQSKNPKRFFTVVDTEYSVLKWGKHIILGTTIETNRDSLHEIFVGRVPSPLDRQFWLQRTPAYHKMVSIEPIMDFDLNIFVNWIRAIKPDFVSIGADSKGNGLSEPPAWKIRKLIDALRQFTEVKVKSNLKRLMKEDGD